MVKDRDDEIPEEDDGIPKRRLGRSRGADFQPAMKPVKRCTLQREKYEEIVSAFREAPGNFTHAQKRTGIGKNTLRRAWWIGWKEPGWAKPIKEVISGIAYEAREKLIVKQEMIASREPPLFVETKAEKRREAIRLDAVEERAREGEAQKASLSTAISQLAVQGRLSGAAMALAAYVDREVRKKIGVDERGHKIEGVEPTMDVREGVHILATMSLAAKRSTETLLTAMESLRLHLGDPQKIIGLSLDAPTSKVDGAEAIAEFGEHDFRQILVDFGMGHTTPLTERFIEWQLRRGQTGPKAAEEGVH